MSPIIVLVIGLLLLYLAATGKLGAVFQIIFTDTSKLKN